MPGSSYRGSPTLCEPTLEPDGVLPTLAKKLAAVTLKDILLKMAHQASFQKTPPCATLLSSGHGRPL